MKNNLKKSESLRTIQFMIIREKTVPQYSFLVVKTIEFEIFLFKNHRCGKEIVINLYTMHLFITIIYTIAVKHSSINFLMLSK